MGVRIIFLVKVHLEHLTSIIYKYKNTFNKTRKRETVSYNITIGAFILGFTSVNITVLGLTNPDVNLKRMHQLYDVIILKSMKK